MSVNGRALKVSQGAAYNFFAMASWYRVTLSDKDVVVRKHMELQKAFENVFLAHGWPKDAAMFSNVDTLSHHFYFSPGAVEIAKNLIVHYSGTECAAPAMSDLVMLVGTLEWKQAIFPDEL